MLGNAGKREWHLQTRQLREQLDILLSEARKNEEKLQRFGRLEQQLMTTRALSQLVNIVLNDFRRNFDLDEVRLLLLDENGEWAQVLGATQLAALCNIGLVLVANEPRLRKVYSHPARPRLGIYREDVHADFFAGDNLASVAMLPLVRQGNLMGGLHLASRDASRFAATSGTYFLERLTAFLVMCLENALYFDKLEQFGLTDALTQVNNRRYFDARLKEAVSHALRHKHPLTAMMFDLDHFKQVNDQWGHPVGDLVLQQAAQVIQAVLRGSDSFARYGGEEFVALLPGADSATASEIAQRIRHAIENYAFCAHLDAALSLTISIGLSEIALGEAGMDEIAVGKQLIHDADAALYRAKARGRNCVVVQS